MLDEGLQVLTDLWRGEQYSHRGEYYKLRGELGDSRQDTLFLPTPLQQPRIPIWIGGMWPNKRPFNRGAKWDGVMPIMAGAGLDVSISPDVIREVATFIQAKRGHLQDFDIVAYGSSPGEDRRKASRMMSEFTDAGATWWIEAVDPWHFGWNWDGDWPVGEMQTRIEQGPPKIEF
jgi:hypothetical protein